MSEPIHERHSLDRLAETHLVSQDNVRASTPVVGEEVDTLKLESPELSVLDVVRLFVELDKLAAGVKVCLAKIRRRAVGRAVEETVDFGLRQPTYKGCGFPSTELVRQALPYTWLGNPQRGSKVVKTYI